MTPNHNHIPLSVWGMLLFLSVIWGGSYLFVGIAVKDLSPLVIVMARVVLAAAALLPLPLAFGKTKTSSARNYRPSRGGVGRSAHLRLGGGR